MLFQRILIPTDGSETSQNAVRKGIELGRLTGGRITFLHVVDAAVERMITSWALPVISDELAVVEREGEKALDSALEQAKKEKVAALTRLIRGHPVQVIVEQAKNHDLIVMGTHGLRGLERLLLGSVADGVLHQSQTPVLLLRAAKKRGKAGRTPVVATLAEHVKT